MDVVERVRAAVERIVEVRLAVLFGSRARGRAFRQSDVDLLVDLQPDTDAARRRVQSALGQAVRSDLDLVHAADAKPLLRFEIARDGILVMEREPGAWTDFKTQAMLDWWDWAPYARRIHAAAVKRLREAVGSGPR